MLDAAREFLTKLHSPEGLQQMLADAGPWVPALVSAIVFAETGLLVGFFLPGDSLLITAGVMLAKSAGVNPWLAVACVTAAAIAGNQTGFWLGRKAGHAVFARPDGRFIKRRHFEAAHAYYEKKGPLAIVLARFVPVLRTFVPFTAGVAEMPYRAFVRWDIFGGCLWIWTLMGIGYALGSSPWGKHLHHIILLVVFVSALPLLIGLARRFLRRKAA